MLRHLVVALLFIPIAGATSWNHVGGTPGHTNMLDAVSGPLDVLENGHLVDFQWFIGPAQTDNVLVQRIGDRALLFAEAPVDAPSLPFIGEVTVTATSECFAVWLEPNVPGLVAESIPFECQTTGPPRIQAYDEAAGLLHVCVRSSDPDGVFRVLEAETLTEIDRVAAPSPVAGPGAGQTNFDWKCDGSVFDPGSRTAFINFNLGLTGHHRIVAYDVDAQTPVWSRSYEPFLSPGLDDVYDTAQVGGVVRSLAMSGDLLVATTSVQSQCCSVAFIDAANGDLISLEQMDADEDSGDASAATSPFLVSKRLAAGVLGTDLLLYDATTRNVQRLSWPVQDGQSIDELLPSPSLVDDHLFVPGKTTGVFLRADGLMDPVTWGVPGHHIEWVGQDAAGGAYALTAVARPEGLSSLGTKEELWWHEVEPSTGATLRSVPAHASAAEGGVVGGSQAMPWFDDQILVIATDGAYSVLGRSPATQVPEVGIDDEYPEAGEPVPVHVSTHAQRVIIGWGDGAITHHQQGDVPRHRYADDGTYEVSVVAVFDDGTTATSQRFIHVGQEPLNALQRAFAAENQDMTFGVIGVVLVLLGALASIIARRIGRSRIASGLRELQDIRDTSHRDALGALRDLQQWHGRQEDRLLRGRLTEDQFRVLENRGGRLLRSVADGILEPVADALPDAARRKLEAAYRDGFVDPFEVDGLKAALDGAKLPAAKRRVVDDVLAAWASG